MAEASAEHLAITLEDFLALGEKPDTGLELTTDMVFNRPAWAQKKDENE